jgi:sodium-dependent dicarboxylate transporter 2/3/5
MFQYIFFIILRRKWFFFAIFLMFLIAYSPPTEHLTEKALAVIGITVMAIILFVSSTIPLPATALLIAFFQVFFKINRPEQVARTFAGDSMSFILGILLISNIMISQKIDRRLASLLIKITGFNIAKLLFGIIVICAVLAGFIGQHTAGALLLPVVITLISGFETDFETRIKSAKIFLFALTYSSMVGGMATPSGGARNPLMIEYLWRLAEIKVSYFQWMIMAIPISLILLPIIYFSLRLVFRINCKSITLSDEFQKKIVSDKNGNKLSSGEIRTIGIFLLILFLWIFFSSQLSMGIIALFGVLLYLITGIADWHDISRKTNWGIILIYASSLSLGIAMQQTGVTTALADWIMDISYNMNLDSKPAIITSICLISGLFSNVLSHGPSVAVSGPIFLRFAELSHLNVTVIGIATALAGSFGYLTVIAAPTNTLIYMTGYIKPRDFFKAGIICMFLSIITIVIFILFYWNLLGFEL